MGTQASDGVCEGGLQGLGATMPGSCRRLPHLGAAGVVARVSLSACTLPFCLRRSPPAKRVCDAFARAGARGSPAKAHPITGEPGRGTLGTAVWRDLS
jgi:hypothetical protein